MKKLFLILLLLISNLSYNQQVVIDKCLGINFGSSKTIVKQKMSLKMGCVLNSKESTIDSIIFNGIKVDGRKTNSVVFKFVDDKFYESNIFLSTEGTTPTDLYKLVKSEYNKNLFISEKEYEKTTVLLGDAYKKQDIKYGITYWEDKNGNFITVETNNKYVKITYRDALLYIFYLMSPKKPIVVPTKKPNKI